ncbi:hypothetical protein [Haloquadratum walsbyi]|jgi:hypothetical protein|uniref:Uncharacterized protein n=1 Tax=Haloquadratum walsbyi J07HQW2 TaxID=1238425 RepID=U1NB15_9EURY|nr:hypothetical protein [Haloquadratum walsbyi]ERG94050.1 MAG: hypothetical protein J07HQW2_00484 [Haloquadratum walsbyi J07HQW2]
MTRDTMFSRSETDSLCYEYGAEESQPYTPDLIEKAIIKRLGTQKRDHRERGKGRDPL